MRLDQPSRVNLHGFTLPVTGDLGADHGDHERDNRMSRVTVVDEFERQTRYAPETVNVEAAAIEG